MSEKKFLLVKDIYIVQVKKSLIYLRINYLLRYKMVYLNTTIIDKRSCWLDIVKNIFY